MTTTIEKWDYKGNTKYKYVGEQNDWNQTLMTKLNMLSVGEYNFPIKIISPKKFSPLFESLEYYNKKTQKINFRYIFMFTNIDSNIITVNHKNLEILNYED